MIQFASAVIRIFSPGPLLPSPARLSAIVGIAITLDWKKMRLATKAETPLPKRRMHLIKFVSADAKPLALTHWIIVRLVRAGAGPFHMFKNSSAMTRHKAAAISAGLMPNETTINQEATKKEEKFKKSTNISCTCIYIIYITPLAVRIQFLRGRCLKTSVIFVYVLNFEGVYRLFDISYPFQFSDECLY